MWELAYLLTTSFHLLFPPGLPPALPSCPFLLLPLAESLGLLVPLTAPPSCQGGSREGPEKQEMVAYALPHVRAVVCLPFDFWEFPVSKEIPR